MERLNILNSHLTTTPTIQNENLLKKYRDMSNVDISYLKKLYFGPYEEEFKRFQKILLENKEFK